MSRMNNKNNSTKDTTINNISSNNDSHRNSNFRMQPFLQDSHSHNDKILFKLHNNNSSRIWINLVVPPEAAWIIQSIAIIIRVLTILLINILMIKME